LYFHVKLSIRFYYDSLIYFTFELSHILYDWPIYNIILAYIYHAYNKFYIILILGILVRVYLAKRVEVNSRVAKHVEKSVLESDFKKSNNISIGKTIVRWSCSD